MASLNPRLESLGGQLISLMRTLSQEFDGAVTVLFLDVLARLEAFPARELSASGLDLVLREARTALKAEPRVTQLAYSALDVSQLVQRTEALARETLATSDDQEIETWARDLMLLATIAPFFTPAQASVIEDAVLQATSIASVNPGAFAAAVPWVNDRVEHEHLHDVKAPLVSTLVDDFEMLADEPPEASAPAGREETARLLEGAMQQLKPQQRTAVRLSLADAPVREAEIFQLFSPAGTPSQRVQFAAAHGDEARQVLLRRHGDGAFELAWNGRSLELQWKGKGTPEVFVLEGAKRRKLARKRSGKGAAWSLDAEAKKGAPRLVAQFGDEEIEVIVPAQAPAPVKRKAGARRKAAVKAKAAAKRKPAPKKGPK